MKTGRVFRKFALGDSRKVGLREAERRDLEKLLAFINGLVSEKRRDESSQLFTGFESRFRKRQEAEWLDDLVRRTQKGDTVSVLAEVDGEIVGNGEITQGSYKETRHPRHLALTIREAYRCLSIG